MNNFQKTYHTLTSLIERLVVLMGWHKCEQCGSFDTDHSSCRLARGWNNWCNQAYSDAGWLCNKCHHITWDKTLAEHMVTLPDWCKPYN